MLVWDTHKLLCKVARDARMLRSFVVMCELARGRQSAAASLQHRAGGTADRRPVNVAWLELCSSRGRVKCYTYGYNPPKTVLCR